MSVDDPPFTAPADDVSAYDWEGMGVEGPSLVVPTEDGEPAEDDEAAGPNGFDSLVEGDVRRIKAREAAQQIIRREKATAVPLPEIIRLDQLLTTPDPEISYRIDGWWLAGGRNVLAAQRKAGKTTLRDNLIRSLVDGDQFLGRFDVTQVTGSIVVIDLELSTDTIRKWLRRQGVHNTERVHVIPMRGRAARFDLRDDEVRALWVKAFQALDTEALLVDCLGPLLTALGLDANREAGQFLDLGLDPLLTDLGGVDCLVTHHMGHGPERSRGDSRIRDWPDAEWRLVYSRAAGEDPDDEPDERAPRFLSAFGRDVDQPEGMLEFDPITKTLTLVGGSRGEVIDRLVLDAVVAQPGITANRLCKQIRSGRPKVLAAIDRAVAAGKIRIEYGPNRAHFHYPVVPVVPGGSEPPVVGGSPPFRENHHSQPPIETKTTEPLGEPRR
jgi:AAA domain